MDSKTKKRKAAYEKQLKACGFRSWKRANQRRGELINRDGNLTVQQAAELEELQKLADMYLEYKSPMDQALDEVTCILVNTLLDCYDHSQQDATMVQAVARDAGLVPLTRAEYRRICKGIGKIRANRFAEILKD